MWKDVSHFHVLVPKLGVSADQLQQEYREDSRPLKAAALILTKLQDEVHIRLAYRYFQTNPHTLGTGNVEKQSQDFVVWH